MQTRICSHVIDKKFIDYYSSTSFNVYPWYLLVAMQANQYESIKELEDSTDTRTIGSTRVATQLQYSVSGISEMAVMALTKSIIGHPCRFSIKIDAQQPVVQ